MASIWFSMSRALFERHGIEISGFSDKGGHELASLVRYRPIRMKSALDSAFLSLLIHGFTCLRISSASLRVSLGWGPQHVGFKSVGSAQRNRMESR